MTDACSGDVGRIEDQLTVALAVGNGHMHTDAMGDMLTAFMNGRKNIPDEIKACNAQRASG